MRTLAPILLCLTVSTPALLLAASAPAADLSRQLSGAAARARAEADSAERRAAELQRAADAATSEAARLHSAQAAAAEAMIAAEARISAADARLRLLGAAISARKQRLREQRRPAAALLAGLATMSLRPPLLTLLDDGSTDEYVRVQALLDATMPVIRQRTARLAESVEQTRALQRSVMAARSDLRGQRQELQDSKHRFARLEGAALELARERGTLALAAGDIALAGGEQAGQLARRSADRRAAEEFAADLSQLPPAPARPSKAAAGEAGDRLRYALPATAPVTEGLGEVGPAGVRSRGLTLATRRGARLRVPAAGIVRFAGPFQDYDGVIIIDHGGGWVSLLLNVATPIERGTRVRAGAPLGRALGPVGVELSRNGQHFSPALIAGSSPGL